MEERVVLSLRLRYGQNSLPQEFKNLNSFEMRTEVFSRVKHDGCNKRFGYLEESFVLSNSRITSTEFSKVL